VVLKGCTASSILWEGVVELIGPLSTSQQITKINTIQQFS
jgi:hypothetical protein